MSKYNRCLVIDSAHIARSIIPVQRGFTLFYKGNAEIISNHPEMFGLVDKTLEIYKPSIIKVQQYINIKHQKVPLNRDNIFKRDDYKCVYCESTEVKTFTLDHVIPQSKGGPDTWENLVTACKACNCEKDNLTLEEYGKEIPIPQRPHYLMMLKKIKYMPEEWRHYLFL